ncbi:hypothetical protein [Halorussus aquaticus]|uniref:Nickel/cobalt efflux system n=1 Tax=Halorussus aquaticus TaxID=2953748 RepID=A0ABD5Q030_9EURY|nr:hypothetical protein [Halorussus aquaticus]
MSLLATLGVFGAAVVLGVTHGLEPDHAAGISALTSETDSRGHAAFVGASFAVGHALIVVAWVALLSALGASASAAPEALGTVGSTLAGVVLGAIALLLGVTGVRRLRGLPPEPRSADASDPTGRVLAAVHSRLSHHTHETRTDYLQTGLVGSLFALSPPVSMLAFVSAVVPTAGVASAAGAVAAYALSITVTLALVGGGVGTFVAFTRNRGRRVHATFEIAASAAIVWVAARMLVGV